MSSPKSETSETATPGKRLEQGIARLKMSKGDAANKMGYHRGYLSALISGKSPFTRNVAHRAEERLGIPASWLLSGLGAMKVTEEAATYEVAHPGPSSAVVGGISRTAWHCANCYAELKEYAGHCHGCGCRIDWSREVERQKGQ